MFLFNLKRNNVYEKNKIDKSKREFLCSWCYLLHSIGPLVCSCLFCDKNRFSKEAILRCPIVGKHLKRSGTAKFLAYPVSPNRGTLSAVQAIDDVLVKMKEVPEDLTFVVEGNPIYLLAQHFFAQQGIRFDVTQVIGLTNEDPVSTAFRPLKQTIERLNRTFKGNYRSTHGFGSEKGSVSYVTLFVFLRPHASLEGKVPVVNPALSGLLCHAFFCSLRPCYTQNKPLACLSRAIAVAFHHKRTRRTPFNHSFSYNF